MSTFAVLLVCLLACLMQNVFGQYLGGPGCGYAVPAIDITHACAAFTPAAAYGGTGEGNVAVAGELPVTGNTAIAGQVPIMGAVSFGGAVPAVGAVFICGQCACGCESPVYY